MNRWSSSYAFDMNATVFEIEYWSFMTERMHLNWKYVIYEMLALVALSALAIVYAWFVERDEHQIPVLKKQKKLQSVKVLT